MGSAGATTQLSITVDGRAGPISPQCIVRRCRWRTGLMMPMAEERQRSRSGNAHQPPNTILREEEKRRRLTPSSDLRGKEKFFRNAPQPFGLWLCELLFQLFFVCSTSPCAGAQSFSLALPRAL